MVWQKRMAKPVTPEQRKQAQQWVREYRRQKRDGGMGGLSTNGLSEAIERALVDTRMVELDQIELVLGVTLKLLSDRARQSDKGTDEVIHFIRWYGNMVTHGPLTRLEARHG